MSEIVNPYLDIVKARRDYRDFKWSRLADVLLASIAERVIHELVKKVEFENCFMVADNEVGMSDTHLAALPEEQRAKLITQVYESASLGKGYLYACKNIDCEYQSNEPTMLVNVFNWLNSNDTLELVSDITGCGELQFASCNAVRFSKGHFITNGAQCFDTEKGKVGFVIDLTPDWNSNWGGLLHLNSVYEGSGVTFTPMFNNMVLFESSYDVSVTYLANFIKYNKFSLMGCFSG